jgi:DNA-binding LacI/PurR family transcriptional regulator
VASLTFVQRRPIQRRPIQRRPTLEDVAALAGVSRALVSLALNDSPRVASSSREAIVKAAAELGYRPNLAARNLASRRTGTIGVLLNDLHNSFFADVYDGLSAAAIDVDLKLLLTTGRNAASIELQAIDAMIEHRVDGIILVGTRITSGQIVTTATTVPTVVIGRNVRNSAVDCVTNHDAEGARIAVEHLVNLGHEHIVHIDGGDGAGAAARRAGFKRASRELGVPNAEIIQGDFTEDAGNRGARHILERNGLERNGLRRRGLRGRSIPTAVFGANDLVAIGVLDTFAEGGLRVPEDVSVMGYDNSALARLSRISLSSIDQSTERLGRVAVELLQSRLGGRNDQRVELVMPTLVQRRTTATRRS